MFTPLHNEMAAAVAELRAQQERIGNAVSQIESATATATTEDRLIKATVDGRGRLTEIAFSGRRWRELAPKDLASRIVEVVTRAQDRAAENTAALMAELMPAGIDLDQLQGSGPDLAAMFDAAVEEAGRWHR